MSRREERQEQQAAAAAARGSWRRLCPWGGGGGRRTGKGAPPQPLTRQDSAAALGQATARWRGRFRSSCCSLDRRRGKATPLLLLRAAAAAAAEARGSDAIVRLPERSWTLLSVMSNDCALTAPVRDGNQEGSRRLGDGVFRRPGGGGLNLSPY